MVLAFDMHMDMRVRLAQVSNSNRSGRRTVLKTPRRLVRGHTENAALVVYTINAQSDPCCSRARTAAVCWRRSCPPAGPPKGFSMLIPHDTLL